VLDNPQEKLLGIYSGEILDWTLSQKYYDGYEWSGTDKYLYISYKKDRNNIACFDTDMALPDNSPTQIQVFAESPNFRYNQVMYKIFAGANINENHSIAEQGKYIGIGTGFGNVTNTEITENRGIIYDNEPNDVLYSPEELINTLNLISKENYKKRIVIFNESFTGNFTNPNIGLIANNEKTVVLTATDSNQKAHTSDFENAYHNGVMCYYSEFAYHLNNILGNSTCSISELQEQIEDANSLEPLEWSNIGGTEFSQYFTSLDYSHVVTNKGLSHVQSFTLDKDICLLEPLNVYNNNILIKANSTVDAVSKNRVTLFNDSELTIEEGVTFNYYTNTCALIIKDNASFTAIGEADDNKNIIFNAVNPNMQWNGIDIYGNVNVNMEYCTVKNADIGISFYNYNDNSDPTIRNCTFENNNIGTYVYSSTPWFYKNTFQNNSHTDISVMGKYACPYLKKHDDDGTLTYNNVILGEAVEGKNASITLEPGGTIFLADGNNKIVKGEHTSNAIRNYTAAAVGADPLNAQYNYWGKFNIEDINGLFSPNANDNPWIDCSNFMPDNISRLKTAIALEESGDKESAKTIYSELIPEDNTITLMSIPRMKNSSAVPSEFIEYANSIEDNLTGTNSKALKKAKAEAYLEANNYNAALSQYMELRAEAVTDEEIAEADLDIALLQMNEQVTARINGNWVSAGISSERFGELRTEVYDLRDRLLNRDSNPENQNSDKMGKFQITNSPNPFNPSTTLKYVVPQNSQIELSVYNLMGQKVRTLVNESKEEGEYSIVWNGKDNKGSQVASGVYFYRLTSHGIDKAKGKMLLIK